MRQALPLSALLPLLPLLQAAAAVAGAARRSVLYIIVDDLRPELGYSSPSGRHLSTPNVDALAARSTIFDRAYVQQVRTSAHPSSIRAPCFESLLLVGESLR